MLKCKKLLVFRKVVALPVCEQRVIYVLAEEIDTRSPAEHGKVCGATVTVLHPKDDDCCNEAIAYYVIGNAPYFLYFDLKLPKTTDKNGKMIWRFFGPDKRKYSNKSLIFPELCPPCGGHLSTTKFF